VDKRAQKARNAAAKLSVSESEKSPRKPSATKLEEDISRDVIFDESYDLDFARALNDSLMRLERVPH